METEIGVLRSPCRRDAEEQGIAMGLEFKCSSPELAWTSDRLVRMPSCATDCRRDRLSFTYRAVSKGQEAHLPLPFALEAALGHEN